MSNNIKNATDSELIELFDHDIAMDGMIRVLERNVAQDEDFFKRLRHRLKELKVDGLNLSDTEEKSTLFWSFRAKWITIIPTALILLFVSWNLFFNHFANFSSKLVTVFHTISTCAAVILTLLFFLLISSTYRYAYKKSCYSFLPELVTQETEIHFRSLLTFLAWQWIYTLFSIVVYWTFTYLGKVGQGLIISKFTALVLTLTLVPCLATAFIQWRTMRQILRLFDSKMNFHAPLLSLAMAYPFLLSSIVILIFGGIGGNLFLFHLIQGLLFFVGVPAAVFSIFTISRSVDSKMPKAICEFEEESGDRKK